MSEPFSKKSRVAVVILNWNGASMLRRFLPSVLEYTPEADIIVADNASTDDSIMLLETEFPSVRRILLDQNYGFAEGYNQALRQVEAEYYLLLNNDVRVTPGWLQTMLAYLDSHPQIVACQPKLRCEWAPESLEYAGASGGYIDRFGYPYCRGRLLGDVEPDKGQYDDVVTISWATGAALLIRSVVYWQVGGLDGRFFAHQEEIDLCWRIRSRGYDVVCIPQSVVYHLGGGTLPKESPRKTYLNFRNNLLLLYKNLPNETLHSVMRWRFWLDALASLHLLLQGQFSSFLAVWRGRRDFCRMKSDFQADRERNLQATVPVGKPVQSSFSLLWQYYVLRHHTFDRLPHTE